MNQMQKLYLSSGRLFLCLGFVCLSIVMSFAIKKYLGFKNCYRFLNHCLVCLMNIYVIYQFDCGKTFCCFDFSLCRTWCEFYIAIMLGSLKLKNIHDNLWKIGNKTVLQSGLNDFLLMFVETCLDGLRPSFWFGLLFPSPQSLLSLFISTGCPHSRAHYSRWPVIPTDNQRSVICCLAVK